MADLGKEILKARTREREINQILKKMSLEIEELEEEVQYAEETLDQKISDAEDEYVEQEYEKIKAKVDPKVLELEEEIKKLTSYMNSQEVEEDEEMAKAKETKEYLNGAAIQINKYYEELKRVSSPYFIDLAYTRKRFSIRSFRKVFKTLPSRISDLEALRVNLTQPFAFVNILSSKKNTNFSFYISSTLLSWWVALCTPIAFNNSVKRARYLHDSATLYHKLMHTLVSLQEKTDDEIAAIFEKLLALKSKKVLKLLDEKKAELEALSADLDKELDSVKFDADSLRRKEDMKIASLKMRLESAKEQYEALEEELENIKERLEEMLGEKSDLDEKERMLFLQAREEREVVMPDRLLYDWSPTYNSYFEITHGLYLFTERETVSSFIQMFIFQIRNIMEWGSVQFRILDLLGAEFVSPLMLPLDGKAKSQDISIFTLREEREQIIEMMHDLLVRRRQQILQVVPSIGDYNLLQKSSGSSPMPYQIIFILLTDAIKMDEKLIQLIHNGEKLGLLVFIFMEEDLLNSQLARSIETYFKTFAELSPSGITTYEPETYRIMLEQAEADRKSNI